MSNAVLQFFLRRRHKLTTSSGAGEVHTLGSQSLGVRGGMVPVDDDDVKDAATRHGRTEGPRHTGLDKTDLAPSTVHQLTDKIEKQRHLLLREFDLQRMHRELIHLEIEKLQIARENQLMNRQFMAVLNERRELDRERKEMIAAAVAVWKTLSGDKNTFTSKKVHNLSEAVSKALCKSASTSLINDEEPRLLKRLRRCKTEDEVRRLQADLKKKQEALFQLLLKSETMIATGTYCSDTNDEGQNNDGETPAARRRSSHPVKVAVKRLRPSDSTESHRPVDPPPQPPNQQPANTEQPPSTLNVVTISTNEIQPAIEPISDDRPRSRNVLTWNLDVRGLRETAI